MRRGAVAGDQGFEAAARAHRPQLAVIADHHHLGPGVARGLQQPQQSRILGHGRLVEDDHVAVGELQVAVVEAPGQRGQGPGLLDAGGVAQGAGGLAGGGGADDLEALGLEGVRHSGQCRCLAGAGHADHQLRAPPRRGDGPHRRALAQGQVLAHGRLTLGHGRAGGEVVHFWRVGTGDLALHGGGDGLLGGHGGGGGPHPAPGSSGGHQGQRLRIGQHAVDHAGQLGRIGAEELGGHGDHHMAAGEDLAGGQRAVGSQGLGHDIPIVGQSWP